MKRTIAESNAQNMDAQPVYAGSTNGEDDGCPDIERLGTANICTMVLSSQENAVLSNLEAALVEGDVEEVNQVVKSFAGSPVSANRLMDSLSSTLMAASIYCSWQTLNDESGAVGHLGLYYFDRANSSTYSVMFSTHLPIDPVATEETIGLERRKQVRSSPERVLKQIAGAINQTGGAL